MMRMQQPAQRTVAVVTGLWSGEVVPGNCTQ
jgi:hypothetical protein